MPPYSRDGPWGLPYRTSPRPRDATLHEQTAARGGSKSLRSKQVDLHEGLPVAPPAFVILFC
eukprot:4930935-Alexandrium_andersonii.AAC.1